MCQQEPANNTVVIVSVYKLIVVRTSIRCWSILDTGAMRACAHTHKLAQLYAAVRT